MIQSNSRRRSGRRIYLPVPVKARDLEGHALIAYFLERRYGHTVLLQGGVDSMESLLEFGADAVVLDYLGWYARADQARAAHAAGMKVIVLPTAGLYQDHIDHARSAGKDTGVGGIVDSYLAWGSEGRNAIVSHGTVADERVHIVGSPRFDLYHPSYRGLVPSRADFLARFGITDASAPVILWATSTNHSYLPDPEAFVRTMTKGGKIPEAEIRAILADEPRQFAEHSRLVKVLADRHPDWQFIIKIHPLEWINQYVELARGVPNIHLAFNAPIREFLVHCDVLLQRCCTTATEAWMLEKPVLELAVGTYHGQTPAEHLAGNHVVSSIDETERVVGEYLAGREIDDAHQRAREAYLERAYYRIDGRSSERCAEHIDRLLQPPSYTDEDSARTRTAAGVALHAWRRKEGARFSNRIKDALGVSRNSSLRIWRRWTRRRDVQNLGLFTPKPLIEPEDVRVLHEGYDRVLGMRGAASSGAAERSLRATTTTS